jgi:SAM-dependent methyltransferase
MSSNPPVVVPPAVDPAPSGYLGWKSWDAAAFGRCGRREARYFGWLLHRVRGGVAPCRVLEIGFGNGQFLGFAKNHGLQVSGIEIEPELLRRASALGVPAHASLDDLAADARFDLIVAFDVLEHVPQDALPGFLRTITGHLAAGGTAVCRVPNGESPFGRLHQHGDLTHCTTLTLGKFQQLAVPLGLQVACLGEAPWHALPYAGRSPKHLLRAWVRSLLEHAVGFAYCWSPARLTPNLLVTLQRDSSPA